MNALVLDGNMELHNYVSSSDLETELFLCISPFHCDLGLVLRCFSPGF